MRHSRFTAVAPDRFRLLPPLAAAQGAKIAHRKSRPGRLADRRPGRPTPARCGGHGRSRRPERRPRGGHHQEQGRGRAAAARGDAEGAGRLQGRPRWPPASTSPAPSGWRPTATPSWPRATAGRILVFRAQAGGGVAAARPRSSPPGLQKPYGIAFHPPASPTHVYVGEHHQVVRFPYYPTTAKAAGPRSDRARHSHRAALDPRRGVVEGRLAALRRHRLRARTSRAGCRR